MEMETEALNDVRSRALGMLQAGDSLHDILAYLVREGEAISPDQSVCSVLLIDQDGLLRNGASPNLPADYLAAIDRLKPDPKVGTCAAAAATGEAVITPSFLDDAKWRELKHLPMALGFSAAWSQPIIGADGRVLGTFGTYFREKRSPGERERDAIRRLAQIAGAVLERSTARTP